jgi:hypothetical protein
VRLPDAVVLLPVPAAPMALLPLPLVVVSVLAVPLVLGLVAEPEAAVLPLVLGVLGVLGLVVLVLGLAAVLPPEALPDVEPGPEVAPAVAGCVGLPVPVSAVPELDEPAVWAMESPPKARAAAAASIVRVFLVVVISNSLNGNPEGNRLNKAGNASCSQPTFPSAVSKVGFCRHSL